MRYKVHNPHRTAVTVPAKTADGIEVKGVMPAIIAELIPVDGGPTLTIHARCPTDETKAAAQALYKDGNLVEVTISAAE